MARETEFIGCFMAAIVGVTLIAGAGFAAYWYFENESYDMPVSLEDAGVRVGDGLLTRKVIAQSSALGYVTDIRVGEFLAEHEGKELLAISDRVARYFAKDGEAVGMVEFEADTGDVEYVALGPDGEYGFIDRSNRNDESILYDATGESRWRYGEGLETGDMCAGDLDGDGIPEFGVGCYGSGGVHLLDIAGKVLWTHEAEDVYRVAIMDVDGSGTMRLVHNDTDGHLTVLDKSGEELSHSEPEPYVWTFSTCRWPKASALDYCITSGADKIWLLDADGTTALELAAPGCAEWGETKGTPVQLEAGGPEHLAVCVNYSDWERSILYLYDSKGALVYHEVLEEFIDAITAIPDDSGEFERLLVGVYGEVWEYTWTKLDTPD